MEGIFDLNVTEIKVAMLTFTLNQLKITINISQMRRSCSLFPK